MNSRLRPRACHRAVVSAPASSLQHFSGNRCKDGPQDQILKGFGPSTSDPTRRANITTGRFWKFSSQNGLRRRFRSPRKEAGLRGADNAKFEKHDVGGLGRRPEDQYSRNSRHSWISKRPRRISTGQVDLQRPSGTSAASWPYPCDVVFSIVFQRTRFSRIL